MRGSASLLVVLAMVLAACGDREEPIPPTDLALTVEPDTYEVATGEAFGLRVVRTWRKADDPAPWDEAALSPLTVRLESTSRREDAERIEETLHYRAYAFSLEDAKVPTVVFASRPKTGGDPRIVATVPFVIAVTPTLDPEALGEPEPFGAMRSERTSWMPWAAALAALVLAGAVWRLRRATPAGSEPRVEPPPETPYDRATARLATIDTDVVEAAEVLRDYVAAQWEVPTRVRTSEEVLAAGPIAALPAADGAGLGDVLHGADLVKFAAYAVAAERAVRLVAEARAFVEVTGRGS